jgi:hypothetical protein
MEPQGVEFLKGMNIKTNKKAKTAKFSPFFILISKIDQLIITIGIS